MSIRGVLVFALSIVILVSTISISTAKIANSNNCEKAFETIDKLLARNAPTPTTEDILTIQQCPSEEIAMYTSGLGGGVAGTCSNPGADVNNDGIVNVQDLTIVILAWHTSNPNADTNGDNWIDIEDLIEIILGWHCEFTEDALPVCDGNAGTFNLDFVRANPELNYIQTCDIDLNNQLFAPIGVITNGFSGTYDGNGYKISNINIDFPNQVYQGFFGEISEGIVSDLRLENVYVSAQSNAGGIVAHFKGGQLIDSSIEGVTANAIVSAGGVIGTMVFGEVFGTTASNVAITPLADLGGGFVAIKVGGNIYSSSVESGNVNGNAKIGGFAGMVVGGGSGEQIKNSYSEVSVSGNEEVGGFAGFMSETGSVDSSYSNSNVIANNMAGGFLGHAMGNAEIQNSHSHGSVYSPLRVGGFAGKIEEAVTIERSYSTGPVSGMTNVGGFMGSEQSDVSIVNFNHYDIESSGQANGCGSGYCGDITGHTTQDMRKQTTFSNWDFENVWEIFNTFIYPFLKWEHPISDVCSQTELDAVRNNLNNAYRQICDISLSGQFEPIGTLDEPFTGIYFGNSHTISDLSFNNPNQDNIGLFGVSEGQIFDVSLYDVSLSGKDNVGSLIGLMENGEAFSNSVKGGSVSGSNKIGGLFGSISISNPTHTNAIENCKVSIIVQGGNQAGGVVGQMSEQSRLEKCYSIKFITGLLDTGGFVGLMQGNSLIRNSYSVGGALGTDRVGGFAGQSLSGTTIQNSYSTGGGVSGSSQIGGFVGLRDTGTSFSQNHYNIGFSGPHPSCNGVVCSDSEVSSNTQDEMIMQQTFSGWNFVNDWDIIEETTHPFFNGQEAACLV